MAITIIKTGSIPDPNWYATCRHCKTEFSFTDKDAKEITTDNRHADVVIARVGCPLCNKDCHGYKKSN